MSTTEREYLSVTETAKLIRQALKAQHPGVKFSVRSSSYAGGASIDVSWTDGPTEESVDRTVQLYRGATFDGMRDLKEYHDSVLVSAGGEITHVHFGADFVFCHRSQSAEELARLEVLAGINWHNGSSQGVEWCQRCRLRLPERCFYLPTPEGSRWRGGFYCSAECWAHGAHVFASFTAV